MLVLRWKGSINWSLSHATELCLSACCHKVKTEKQWNEAQELVEGGVPGLAFCFSDLQFTFVHSDSGTGAHMSCVHVSVSCVQLGRKEIVVIWWVSVVFLNVFDVLDFYDDAHVSISASDWPHLLNWQKDPQPGLDLTNTFPNNFEE